MEKFLSKNLDPSYLNLVGTVRELKLLAFNERLTHFCNEKIKKTKNNNTRMTELLVVSLTITRGILKANQICSPNEACVFSVSLSGFTCMQERTPKTQKVFINNRTNKQKKKYGYFLSPTNQQSCRNNIKANLNEICDRNVTEVKNWHALNG